MAYFDTLQAETQAEREGFQSIGLIQNTIQNGVTPEAYGAYLTQAYHHVRYTVPLLELALSKCGPEDGAYRNALLEYIDEERGHEEWILDDIKALGLDAQAVRNGQGGHACRVMVGYAHYVIEHVSPYAFLGMVHVLEGMSVELATRAAAAIQGSLGGANAPEAFSYLTSHGSLDEDHVAFFEGLVNALNDPEKEAHITQAAKDFYILFGNMFRELELQLAAA